MIRAARCCAPTRARPSTTKGTRPSPQKELAQAAQLDPRDPVAPYSALQARRENRLNDAITHLQHSLDLNDNRAVYRSPFLLDQDRAVRGADAAVLYAEVGLQAFAERTATRAVNADYANPSAHLFLANSYDARRDPRQISLRYETPWLSESLVGNLLAPVGAAALSPTLSRNEYSALFERDGLRFASETQWTSQGDWLQHAAQAGQYGRFAYALDARYRSETGARPNADFEQLALTATVREQLGAADGLLIQATATTRSGDVIPRYDPANAIRTCGIERRRTSRRDRLEPRMAPRASHPAARRPLAGHAHTPVGRLAHAVLCPRCHRWPEFRRIGTPPRP